IDDGNRLATAVAGDGASVDREINLIEAIGMADLGGREHGGDGPRFQLLQVWPRKPTDRAPPQAGPGGQRTLEPATHRESPWCELAAERVPDYEIVKGPTRTRAAGWHRWLRGDACKPCSTRSDGLG